MLSSPAPQPLTRLNVTKHDRIWNKETSKIEVLGFGTVISLFSPPLKHITPETTEELWEKFNPLDLIDSASENSVKTESSMDTMIMMTSAEEQRNKERIKNSFEQFQHQKNVRFSQMKPISKDYLTRDLVIPQNSNKCAEEDFLNDEGYGTDNRTNTTASLSSPLSSSLSSLLTSESSSSQGSMQRTHNGNARSQHIAGNGRLVVGHRPNVTVKKKVQPVEKQDNTLMEKLRALTTIQEEEGTGFDNNTITNPNLPRNKELRSEDGASDCSRLADNAMYANDHNAYSSETMTFDPSANSYANEQGRPMEQQSHGTGQTFVSNSSYGKRGKQTYLGDDGKFYSDSASARDGIFRAVPVKIGQTPSRGSAAVASHVDDVPVNGGGSGLRHAGSVEKRGSDSKFWNREVVDVQYRVSEPVESIDSVRSGDVTVKNVAKVPNYVHWMPKLAKDPRSVAEQDQVVVRRPKPNCYVRKADLRYSWDCSDLNQVDSKCDLESKNLSNNLPVKICEAPKLSNQLRASSEMSLQNGRPLFATSSNIYRLFQGQSRGYPGFSQGKPMSHRHSFHTMPQSNTNFSLVPTDVSMEDIHHRLCSASLTQGGATGRTKNGPVRGNHELHSSNSNHSDSSPHQINLQRPRPNSVAETTEKLSTLV